MEKLQAFVDKLPDILKPWGEEILLRYVDFQGTTDRKTFWTVFLTNFVIGCILGVLVLIPVLGVIAGILSWVYSLATIVPGIAITVRRLNDIGKSWPYIFFSFIPCVGSIILIVFLAQPTAE
nr:DUF805 domain-containing protein [Lachnospiraceae bacterium]